MGWYTRLSRITTSNRFIPEVDGLRFIAIITVVLLHINTHLLRVNGEELKEAAQESPVYPFLQNGGLGVLLFFAISGFILALPFASFHLGKTERKPNLKSYYLRRLTRLEPPYIITLLLFFTALVATRQGNFIELLPNMLASFFYSHFFIYGAWSPINPVTWSLETEVQFYLLAPFIAGFFGLKKTVTKWGLLLVIILGIPVLYENFIPIIDAWHLSKSLLVYLPLFLVGFALAEYYHRYPTFFPDKSSTWDVVGLVSIGGLYFGNHPYDANLKYIFYGACALLFIAAFKGKGFNRFLTHPFISTTGGMCYTIYLLHYPMIAIVGNFVIPKLRLFPYEVQYLLFALLILPLLYVASSVFFILIEKPCMNKNWPIQLRDFLSKVGPGNPESETSKTCCEK